MLYSILMLDKPGATKLREEVQSAHRDYVGKHLYNMRMGGPLMSEDGQTMIGSLIIKEFNDRKEAEEFVAGEPYNQAELFELVIIRPFQSIIDNAGL